MYYPICWDDSPRTEIPVLNQPGLNGMTFREDGAAVRARVQFPYKWLNSMVRGRYNTLVNGVYKPILIVNHPPVITNFMGGMVTIPSHGW